MDGVPPSPFGKDKKSPETLNELGKFVELEVIGVGGMAVVFKARDSELDRIIALKVLKKDLRLSQEELLTRFEQEAINQAKLDDIPAIAKIYETGKNNGWAYLVMEYIEGRDISDYACRNCLKINDKIELLARLADILAELHERGFVHRDIKAENVMVTGRGEIKLLDLGLVKPLIAESDLKLTRTGQIIGTPACLTPEMCRTAMSGNADFSSASLNPVKADVYALGFLVYEIITGQSPYSFKVVQASDVFQIIANQSPATISDPRIGYKLKKILFSTLDKNPDRRPTAAEFAHQLRNAKSGHINPGWTALLIGLVCVIVLAGTLFFLCSDYPESKPTPPVASPESHPKINLSGKLLNLGSGKKERKTSESKPEVPEKLAKKDKTTEPVVSFRSIKQAAPELYINSAPETLREEWRKKQEELPSSFPGKGALFYSLPPETKLRIKAGNVVIFERSSTLPDDRQGWFYYQHEKPLTLELTGKIQKTFPWAPKSNQADVLY